jgi:hypothetical protein
VALVLVGAAFMAGRLLGAGLEDGGNGNEAMAHVTTANGQTVKSEFVRCPNLPDRSPDVAGAYERREDNSIFVNETEDGFHLSKSEDGSFSVANTTGKISELVVTNESTVLVDFTLEAIDTALVDGKLYQQVEPGSVEEIGEMSYVRAWGEMRGDRLVVDVLLYSRPPVISR